MALSGLQTAPGRAFALVEDWLDHERDQLPLWLPVALGTGIGLWFAIPSRTAWVAVILAGLAIACGGTALGSAARLARAMRWGGLLIAFGCALIWWRASHFDPRPITRPATVEFAAAVEKIELRPAEGKARLLLAPMDAPDLPGRVRVSVALPDVPQGLGEGAKIALRARLMPPSEAPLPGAYDFSRTAWFQGIGATGRVLGRIEVRDAGPGDGALRASLSAHVRQQLPGSAGGIAAAFATGDRGGIDPEDEEAMRASGLTHLLSISGLHITAVVGAAMVLTLRLLALSSRLAMAVPLPVVAALGGAIAGVSYTLLTGAEVPTIRSCIAALLVLAGLALGREAITMRLVATGALIVLLLLPESIVGPSFQLSFAAIAAIVALHELGWVRRWTMAREEGWAMKSIRGLGALLLTGIAVEIALAPIALYHFHKSGLYGALANIVAIPLTTFVIMPAEALALLCDTVGLGAPFWWIAGQALAVLLWLARSVAAAPGAVAMLPVVPLWAFVVMVAGGLWVLLWSSRKRWLGAVPFAVGAAAALMAQPPDLLVTGDGRHLAVRGEGGSAILRERAGSYIREVVGEQTGERGEASPLDNWPGARCSRDLCIVALSRGGRSWQIAATRSPVHFAWRDIARTCASVDIMVSDRRLPRSCHPRWLKIDPELLRITGGLAINLDAGAIRAVRQASDDHPWAVAARAGGQ